MSEIFVKYQIYYKTFKYVISIEIVYGPIAQPG